MKSIRTLFATCALMLLAMAPGAAADQAPAFMQNTYPAQAVDAVFAEFRNVMLSPDAALDQKTKELISLGVAAQVPCDYCVYYHQKAARALGATEAEIREALASAALVRKWSTMLNGSQYDMNTWRREVDAMFGGN